MPDFLISPGGQFRLFYVLQCRVEGVEQLQGSFGGRTPGPAPGLQPPLAQGAAPDVPGPRLSKGPGSPRQTAAAGRGRIIGCKP